MKFNPGLLALAGVAAVGAYLGYAQFTGADKAPARVSPETEISWIAAAPGRVEPKSGEIRIGTGILGRVIKVHAAVDEKVEEGELLVQLDDSEARARLTSAETQAEALREEREKAFASGREDVRKAEDAIYSAERAVTGARIELDGALIAKRTSGGSDQAVTEARKRLTEANERLERERLAFIRAQSKSNLPAPSSAESAVSAARTEVRMAEALLDKTRIRAPQAGNDPAGECEIGRDRRPKPGEPAHRDGGHVEHSRQGRGRRGRHFQDQGWAEDLCSITQFSRPGVRRDGCEFGADTGSATHRTARTQARQRCRSA